MRALFMDLIITHPFLNQKGGVERVVLEIAKKFSPIIYSIAYDKEKTFSEFKEFEIKILPKSAAEMPFFFLHGDERRSSAVAAGFRYYGYKIKEDYDVINAHGTPSEWIRNKNERVCWYCHSPNREAFDLYSWRMARLPIWKKPINWSLIQAYKVAERKTVPRIEKICTNSEITNERIKKYLKRSDAKVIHPGIDPKEFYCESYEKFFFCPSRIVPEKRFERAIEAFKEFYMRNKDKKWKLIIAGHLHESPKEKRYCDWIVSLAKGYPIEVHANISEKKLKELYSRCYATLFCAINEDWGLIPLESMASYKPCISVNEGGPRYSIRDGKTGFLVNDYYEMATRMLELSLDKGLTERMGREGRKHVVKKYTWKLFLDGMKKAFQETSSKSK